MNTLLKYVLAAIALLGCVSVCTLVGCVAGFLVAFGIPDSVQTNGPSAGGAIELIVDNRWLVPGAFIGSSLGTLFGLAGDGLLAAKVINPSPPHE